MKWIPFILLLLAGTVLDAGNLLNFVAFRDGQIQPSFLLIFLVFFAFSSKTEDAIICSFAIGLAADVSGSVIGPYTVCYGLAGSLLTQTTGLFTLSHPVRKVALVFAAGLIAGPLASWLAALKAGHPSGLALPDILGAAMYSSLVAPLVWPLLQSAFGHMNRSAPSRSRNAASLHV